MALLRPRPALHLRREPLKALHVDCGVTRTRKPLAPVAAEDVEKLGVAGSLGVSSGFEVFEKLGQGSTAVVYRANRRADGKQVALKYFRRDDEEFITSAREEFDLLRKIEHHHVIKALDFSVTPRGVVLCLEYFQGPTLQRAVREAPGKHLSESTAQRLFVMLMQVIGHLHQQGIVHRDIKSDNILVSHDCSDLRVIDFNTARCTEGDDLLTMTGTKAYMPPEVLLGRSPSMGSDIWAAGVCLHFMVVGRLLERLSCFGLDHADFAPDMAKCRASWGHLSAPCRAVLGHCLEVDPELRPPAADVLKLGWTQ